MNLQPPDGINIHRPVRIEVHYCPGCYMTNYVTRTKRNVNANEELIFRVDIFYGKLLEKYIRLATNANRAAEYANKVKLFFFVG